MSSMGNPTHKYDEHVSKLSNCPPTNCKQKSRKAFRFVSLNGDSTGATDGSFLPAALVSPKRVFGESVACSAWGLSLFTTETEARSKHAVLAKKYKKLDLGNTLAQVTIGLNDGISSRANGSGHFTLHEFAGCDLNSSLKIVGKL